MCSAPRMDMEMTAFLNSNHPVVTQIREKMACKELDQVPTHFSYFKSSRGASLLTRLGNEAYNSKKYEEALRYYSESVATAPFGSLELATAFASRSRVLFVRERYNLCLLDVNRALKTFGANVLPVSAKQELIKRKHHCWSKLQTSYLPEKIEEKLKSGIQLRADERQVLYNCNVKMNIDDTDLKMDYENFDDPIWSTKLNNATLSGASSKISAVENLILSSNGWQLVATENIEPGEVLLIREYLTVEVRKEVRHTFCSYCTLWCEALIPCITCTREMYCSESCRQEASNLYHRTECLVSWFLPERRIGWPPSSLLHLRLFLTGTRQGADLANLMHDPNVTALMNRPFHNIWVSHIADLNYYKYLATLSTVGDICTNNVYMDRGCRSLLLDDAVSTINALRFVGFFATAARPAMSTSNDLEIFAAFLLLQHMLINTKKGAEKLMGKLHENEVDGREVCTQKDIGAGVVNVHNLMNHSCDSNTGLIQNRRRLLIYSSRPILRGQQIYDALAPNYTTETLQERRLTLQAHRMECSCEACENDWPHGNDLLERENVYLTANKEIIEDIERLHEWLSEGFDEDGLVYEQFSDEFARAALTSIKKIRQYVKEPSATNLVCVSLIQEYMNWKGNFYHL